MRRRFQGKLLWSKGRVQLCCLIIPNTALTRTVQEPQKLCQRRPCWFELWRKLLCPFARVQFGVSSLLFMAVQKVTNCWENFCAHMWRVLGCWNYLHGKNIFAPTQGKSVATHETLKIEVNRSNWLFLRSLRNWTSRRRCRTLVKGFCACKKSTAKQQFCVTL